jgi:hypothetical protein
MTIDELKREALQLDPSARATLARDILLSLDDLSEAEVEQLWVEEALRRSAEIDTGLVEIIPADQVFAEAKARLAAR